MKNNSMENVVFQKIIQCLDASKVMFDLTTHESVRTSLEAANIRGVDMRTGVKSMLAKAEDEYLLLMLPANKRIDWRKVKNLLHVKKVEIVQEEEAERVLEVKMGSVPPFPDLFGIKGFYDESIFDSEFIFFNPGSTMHSIKMQTQDFRKVLKGMSADIAKN